MFQSKKPSPSAEQLLFLLFSGLYEEMQAAKKQAEKDKQEILAAIAKCQQA